MVHTGCISVANIHLSRTWMPGSFESMQWNACLYRLDLALYSHLKEFWGNRVRHHVNSKGKSPLYRRLRGSSNPWHCIMQDSEPNTQPTELFRPPKFETNRYTSTHGAKHIFIKSSQKSSLPWIQCVNKKISMNLWQHTESHQNWYLNLEENGH